MKTSPLLALGLALGVAACSVEKTPDAAPTATPTATPPPEATQIPGAAAFDLDAVPVSTAALGPFPFIALPDGYVAENIKTLDFARFPFWYNDRTNWVEGMFFQALLKPAPGKQMSSYEIKKNFEALIRQMGGVQVAEGKLDYATTKTWGSEINTGFRAGLNNAAYEPQATIWVVRRQDGNIWVQLTEGDKSAGYVVGKEKAFAPSARLLPASELKRQIDQAGQVDLQVHFATDRTEILPESQPQIEQVVRLLQDDPGLKLAINGHTDNTGDARHNQALSEGRAAAVVAALTASGIDAARLSAAGFGDTRPVADNSSEEGKAKNRRVELVKRP